MAYEFALRHLDRTGTVKNAFVKTLGMYCALRKYGGSLTLNLNADSSLVDTFEKYDFLDLYWRNQALGITSANGGFVRLARRIFMDYEYATDDNNQTMWQGICVAPWEILNFRRAMYHDNITDVTEFSNTPVETIGKELVRLNCTADATTGNGRFRNGNLTTAMGFTIVVATDLGRGKAIPRETRGGRIGDILQDIATDGNGDWILTQTGETEWTLDWSSNQQGSDLYDTVIFSREKKNMRNPKLRHRSIGRATTAVAIGQLNGAERSLSTPATISGYAANDDIEAYYDARDVRMPADLDARAETRLDEDKPERELTFEAAQTTDTFFSGGVSVPGRYVYGIGDIVQAQYFGTFRREVEGIAITVGNTAGIGVGA